MGIKTSVAHIGLSVLGVIKSEAVDIGLLRPHACSFGFDECVHFFADTNEVFAFGIGEELEEFGNGDRHTIIAWTSMRVFGLVLGVFGSTHLLLVRLFFLAFDSILLVDRREQQVEWFADERLTRSGWRRDTREEG